MKAHQMKIKRKKGIQSYQYRAHIRVLNNGTAVITYGQTPKKLGYASRRISLYCKVNGTNKCFLLFRLCLLLI